MTSAKCECLPRRHSHRKRSNFMGLSLLRDPNTRAVSLANDLVDRLPRDPEDLRDLLFISTEARKSTADEDIF